MHRIEEIKQVNMWSFYEGRKSSSIIVISLILLIGFSNQCFASQITTDLESEPADDVNYGKKFMRFLMNSHLKAVGTNNGGERADHEFPDFGYNGFGSIKGIDRFDDINQQFNKLVQSQSNWREQPEKRVSLCAFNAIACKTRKPINLNLKARSLLRIS